MKSKANPRHVFFLSVVFSIALVLTIFSTGCNWGGSGGGGVHGTPPTCPSTDPVNVNVPVSAGAAPVDICVWSGDTITWQANANPALSFQVHFDTAPFPPPSSNACPLAVSTGTIADLCSSNQSAVSPGVNTGGKSANCNIGGTYPCYYYIVTVVGGTTFDPHVIIHP